MKSAFTRNTKRILAGLSYTGVDRIYQQIDSELGMILTLHHVGPAPVPEFAPNAHLTIHPEFLESVVALLKRRMIDIISLDEAHERIQGQSRHLGKFATFTFDDGYQDTLGHAAPVLQKHNLPYTVYLAPGLIEGSADVWWEAIEVLVRHNDHLVVPMAQYGGAENHYLNCSSLREKHEAFAFLLKFLTELVPELDQGRVLRDICSTYNVDLDNLNGGTIMGWDDVHKLKQDPMCTIGAHTLNHRALARLSVEQARQEVVEGAEVLASELGERPKHFAYPYGYRQAAAGREFELMKDLGFKTAVTTRGGMIFPGHKAHTTALPRISINGLYQEMRYFAPLTTGLPTRLSNRLRRVSPS